jgi:hypothetical protein
MKEVMEAPVSSSAPPPSAGPPGGPVKHEFLLELETSRKRRGDRVDLVKLSPLGVELRHTRVLREPLKLPLGAVALAVAEPGGARALDEEGRFPILRRMSATAVVPRDEGVEGWLWTATGGSAFPSLCEENEAPNAALIFTHPLADDVLERNFEPEFVAALAARSALGEPAIYGLLMRVVDVNLALRTFTKFGLGRPLTDREVAPTLRRSLPTDVSPDPTIAFSEKNRAGSVAPPGFS